MSQCRTHSEVGQFRKVVDIAVADSVAEVFKVWVSAHLNEQQKPPPNTIFSQGLVK